MQMVIIFIVLLSLNPVIQSIIILEMAKKHCNTFFENNQIRTKQRQTEPLYFIFFLNCVKVKAFPTIATNMSQSYSGPLINRFNTKL